MISSPPMFNLLVLRTSDIHAAVPFYQALGLSFTLEKHGNGPEHYSTSVNGLVFELYPLGEGGIPTTGTRLGFVVDSVDEQLQALRDLGIEVVVEPHDSAWGRRAVVHDFDGHTVELVTRSRP